MRSCERKPPCVFKKNIVHIEVNFIYANTLIKVTIPNHLHVPHTSLEAKALILYYGLF